MIIVTMALLLMAAPFLFILLLTFNYVPLLTGHNDVVTMYDSNGDGDGEEELIPRLNKSDFVTNDVMDQDKIHQLEQEEWRRAALDNMRQMNLESSVRCETPRPRVIKVQKIHPRASKRYIPSCVLLHRCDRESGCCDDERSVCAPIHKKRIFKYFFVFSLDLKNDGGTTMLGGDGRHMEKLQFINHTRCGCRPLPTAGPPLVRESLDENGAAITNTLHHWTLWTLPTILLLIITT